MPPSIGRRVLDLVGVDITGCGGRVRFSGGPDA